jgi:hypothetical protein
MNRPPWFIQSEKAFHPTMQRIGAAVGTTGLSVDLGHLPLSAYWFYTISLHIAWEANKNGMHANALATTRLCIEAMSIVELGICKHQDNGYVLSEWKDGKRTLGQVRKWLSANVWPQYGRGLWQESWEEFYGKLAGAVQPYAHFTEQLSQWQSRLHRFDTATSTAIIEYGPKIYDSQRATRITLYHGLLLFCLGRIWISSNRQDEEFQELHNLHREALAASKFFDGHRTDWNQTFWAMLWDFRTGMPFSE